MRRRNNLLSNCKTDGTLTNFQTREEIAKEIRHQEFLRFGGTAALYLFSMSVKKSIAEFRQGR
jgi:hypothetical protein